MIIYRDKYNKIVYENCQLVKYYKSIFGSRWIFAEILRGDLDENQAKQLKKTIKDNLNK